MSPSSGRRFALRSSPFVLLDRWVAASPISGVEAYKWSVSVYARNERLNLASCLRAIADARVGNGTHITIILNGSSDSSDIIAHTLARHLQLSAEIYDIRYGDKSNAINQFLYNLRPEAETYFFIDGHATITRPALIELERGLSEADAAVAVPESRADTNADGGLQGSLFALKRSLVERIVGAGLKLPVGLYCGDRLIGSFVSNDLDPGDPTAEPRRSIRVVPAATWTVAPPSPWRRRDLSRQWRHRICQARGRLENEAIKEIIYRDGYQGLPDHADRMIAEWIDKSPKTRRPNPIRDPFAALAVRQIKRASFPRDEDMVPHLLARTRPTI